MKYQLLGYSFLFVFVILATIPFPNAFSAVTNTGNFKYVGDKEPNPFDFEFNNDGTKLFVIGNVYDKVHQYSLSTAYDITTATFQKSSASLGNQDINPLALTFNNNGTKMFVAGNSNDKIFEYTLSTAFDVGSIAYTNNFVASISGTPQAITFNGDGTKLFIGDTLTVYRYNLAVPYSLASSTGYSSIAFSPADEEILFNNDGTKLYIMRGGANPIQQYTLTTPYVFSTSSTLNGDFWFTSISNNPSSFDFSSDGSKFFISEMTNDRIYQFSVSPSFDLIDSVAPTVSSATTTNSTAITLTMSETVEKNSPTAANFVISGASSSPTVSSISASGTSVTLILSAAVTSTNTLTVSYTRTSGDIRDVFGRNILANFANQAVTNTLSSPTPNAPQTPSIVGAPSENTIKFTWQKPLPNGGANTIVGYKIWRASATPTNPPSFTSFTPQLINTTNGNGATLYYTNSSIDAGKFFQFKIAAFNVTGAPTSSLGQNATINVGTIFGCGVTNFSSGLQNFQSGQTFCSGAQFTNKQQFSGDSTFTFTASSLKFGNGTSFGVARTFGSSANFTGAQTFVGYNTFGSGTKFGAGQTFSSKQNLPDLANFTGPTTFATGQFFGAGTQFANKQVFSGDSTFSFTNSSLKFGNGTSFGAARTFGQFANFTGAQTFVGSNQFGLASEFGAGQTFSASVPQNFSKNVQFGKNTNFGAKQTFYSGTKFDTGSTFIANQPMPANVVLPSGLLLTAITCPDTSCTATESQILSPGELLAPGTDPDPIDSQISSNDKSISIPGLGFNMTFDTVSTAGTVSVDLMNPSSVTAASSDASGKLTMTASNGNTLNSIGSIMDVSVNATSGATTSGSMTVTLPYDEANLGGASESSLKMLHYTGGAWITEDSCTKDTVNNKITCTVTSLSPFGIGTSTSTASSSKSGGGGGRGGDRTAPSFISSSTSKQNPITINGKPVTVEQYKTSTIIQTNIIKTQTPFNIKISLTENGGYDNILRMGLYVIDPNQKDLNNAYLQINWENNKPLQIIDENKITSDVKLTLMHPDALTSTFDYTMTFAKPIPKSNVVLYGWDANRNAIQFTFEGALEVMDGSDTQTAINNVQKIKPNVAKPTLSPTADEKKSKDSKPISVAKDKKDLKNDIKDKKKAVKKDSKKDTKKK